MVEGTFGCIVRGGVKLYIVDLAFVGMCEYCPVLAQSLMRYPIRTSGVLKSSIWTGRVEQ